MMFSSGYFSTIASLSALCYMQFCLRGVTAGKSSNFVKLLVEQRPLKSGRAKKSGRRDKQFLTNFLAKINSIRLREKNS